MKEKKNQKIFAMGLCWEKILLFFLIGCIFGTLFEEILYFFEYKEWTSRKGVIYGPFSPLYGMGVVLFLIILGKKNKERNIFKTFIYGSFIGGITEYLVSFLIEKSFNIKFWDYSEMLLNFNGRTTIPIMLIWGGIGTIFLKLIYPHVSNWIEKIPYKIGKSICIIILILLSIDIIISFSAFIRMVARKNGEMAKSFIGEFYDRTYNDEFMYKTFPILKGKI